MVHLTALAAESQRPSRDAGVALTCPIEPAEHLYIHVPFCAHKCHYCDFYSFVDSQDRQRQFTERLIDELRTLAPHARKPLRTVFVGGGTPSLLRPELWALLLRALGDLYDLSLIRSAGRADPEEPGGFGEPGAAAGATGGPGGEFTVECNPESAGEEVLSALAVGGVTRVSLGAQSFTPRHLRTLERLHNPENVGRALERAAAAGIRRRSIDLIYAIPGQTLEEWARDLEIAAGFGLSHVSCYSLTYEPNTAMTARLGAGEFEPADEDLEADMFALTGERLLRAGLERYEVSNFARPGQESLHNLAYWRCAGWLAAGPSASGHALAQGGWRAGSHRWKNVPRLGDWLAGGGYSPIVDHEAPDPRRLLRERLMMGLRLREGIDGRALVEDAAAIGGDDLARALEARAMDLRGRGLLREASAGDEDARRWAVTELGMMQADGVASELMTIIAEDAR